jgi:flap endonuclease-1
MGLNIKDIVPKEEISLDNLKGKKLAVDTYIYIHQFLGSMPELTDNKGRPTAHLSGLFYRTTQFMSKGLKLAYVFDGSFIEPGESLKPKRFPQPRTSDRVTSEMISEAKELLSALGCPVIQAPAEGEAQCAHICQKRGVWATSSQDYDALMFGSPRLVRYLTLAKKRKLPKGGKAPVNLEIINLKNTLKTLGINQKQLTMLAMLVGTDFNPGGVFRIGQKKALDLVKQYKTPKRLFTETGWDFPYDWEDVYELLTKMPVTKRYKLKWAKPNKRKIKRIMVNRHDFSEQRIENALLRLK